MYDLEQELHVTWYTLGTRRFWRSSRRSPSERISFLLNCKLKSALATVPAHLDNSAQLMTAIADLPREVISEYPYPCSLDVRALFTSIPIEDAVSAVGEALRMLEESVLLPLCASDICCLLATVLKETYFVFNKRIYRQISGLPMGCNVSSITAIIFMGKIETAALNVFRRCGLFRRYVDDVYALVKDEQAAKTMFEIFFQQHVNISFELELPTAVENGFKLNLLDLGVTISSDGNVSFEFYRKGARSNVFVHYASHLPKAQKKAIVHNEEQRIQARCTDSNNASAQLAAFDQRLEANGYPNNFRTQRRSTHISSGQANLLPIFYLEMPFLGDKQENKVKRLFRKQGINIRLYRRSCTLFNAVRPPRESNLQCNWPECPVKPLGHCFAKNVVYQVTCNSCSKSYIGHTSRDLHVRIRDHMLGRGSTIHQHITTCSRNKISVSILSREKDPTNAAIAEGLYIRQKKPELNLRDEGVNLV